MGRKDEKPYKHHHFPAASESDLSRDKHFLLMILSTLHLHNQMLIIHPGTCFKSVSVVSLSAAVITRTDQWVTIVLKYRTAMCHQAYTDLFGLLGCRGSLSWVQLLVCDCMFTSVTSCWSSLHSSFEWWHAFIFILQACNPKFTRRGRLSKVIIIILEYMVKHFSFLYLFNS